MKRMRKTVAILLLLVMACTGTAGNMTHVQAEETQSGTDTEAGAGTEQESETETMTELPDQTGMVENSWRYQNGNWITEESESSRNRNGAVFFAENATRTGIDVSEHQGVIDWEKVKASGISFAILRCGYGNDEAKQDDKQWLRNVSECERLGIPFGVYIYSYATNTQMALSEAQHVLRLIAGHNLTYPVYFDMEDKSTMGKDLYTIAQAFCNAIESAGYAVGIYSNLDWWTNYLTNPGFDQWHRWVAQYNTTCDYTGDYAMWQYSSKGSVDGITGDVDMNYLIGNPPNHGNADATSGYLSYKAHVSEIGWQYQVPNNTVAGTIGRSLGVEAITLNTTIPDLGLQYSSSVLGSGWQEEKTTGDISGTVGEAKHLEAVKIALTGNAKDQYEIYYRVHVSELGWLDWAKGGQPAGTKDYGLKIEAIQVWLLPAGSDQAPTVGNAYKEKGVEISLQTHVSEIGWQVQVSNDEVAGTTGKNLGVEAFKLSTTSPDLEVKYSSYVQGKGWQEEKTAGDISGTVGESRHLEAVKIALAGTAKDQYEIYYRVHVSDIGWLGWAKDGEIAGTKNYGLKIEAMQVWLLPAGSDQAPAVGDSYKEKDVEVSYQAHVAEIGWQGWTANGNMAGTTGRALPIEALNISLSGATEGNSIRYQAHVQDIGWQNWGSNGSMAGTTGRALPMEAIKIELTGTMEEQYDIYYRVHSRDYGWLGWARNGEMAGTSGGAKCMEAIEIKVVKKGETVSEYGSQDSCVIK